MKCGGMRITARNIATDGQREQKSSGKRVCQFVVGGNFFVVATRQF